MFDSVDATIEWVNGNVYLVRRTEYVRYDIADRRASWPKTIADEGNIEVTQISPLDPESRPSGKLGRLGRRYN
jgi:hypothetical protein